jgi:hypothetical protein
MEEQPIDKLFRIYLFNAVVCSVIVSVIIANMGTLIDVLSIAAFVLLQLCIYDGLKRKRAWAKYAATAFAVLSFLIWASVGTTLGMFVAAFRSGMDAMLVDKSTLISSMIVCMPIFVIIGAVINGRVLVALWKKRDEV